MASEMANEETVEAKDLDTYIEELSGASRRARQEASHAIAQLAKDNPEALKDRLDDVSAALIDALFRPEAQTRWESLNALCEICAIDPKLVKEGYEGAEAALFDDNSTHVRIAAFRFLCRLSAADPKQSEVAWPIIDEAIRCYHGDRGYQEMLNALLELAQGKASKSVKDSLTERLQFDANSGRGYVQALSADIITAAQA